MCSHNLHETRGKRHRSIMCAGSSGRYWTREHLRTEFSVWRIANYGSLLLFADMIMMVDHGQNDDDDLLSNVISVVILVLIRITSQ